MGAALFNRKRQRLPEGAQSPAQRWLERGLRAAYLLQPGLWAINLVTGQAGGTVAGTGVTFVNNKLRTPGTAGNGATLQHGLVMAAQPISMVVGWTRTSGVVSWSLLQSETSWTGWYAEAIGTVKSSSGNSFDGVIACGGTGNAAFRHSSSSDLTGYAANGGRTTDGGATLPTVTNNTGISLGWSKRDTNDNAAAADFTHLFTFQGALTDAELKELADEPQRLFEPARIWVPVSAGGGGGTAALSGQAVTASAGTLAPSVSLALSGQAVAASAGTLAPSLTLAISGQAVAASASTLAPSLTLAISGQAVTASAGTLAPSVSLALSGQAVTASAGTLLPVTALSGQAVTASAGAVAPSLTIVLSGQAVTASAGAITYNASGNITLALSGQAVTVSAGTVVPAVSLPVSGQSVTAIAGTVAPGVSKAATGTQITTSAGTLTLGIVVPLSGQAATAVTGTVTYGVTGNVTRALTGQVVTVSTGTLVYAVAASGEANAVIRVAMDDRNIPVGQDFHQMTVPPG